MKLQLYLAPLVLGIGLDSQEAWAQAFPINSDVAIQPAEGQFIYRTQIRRRDFDVDFMDTDVETYFWSHVFVYGWTSRLSTVVGVPLVYRDLDNALMDEQDYGVGDIKALLRYQLWKKLGYLESQTWTVMGGVEIPTYDDPFSSRSWDPIVGTVYSWHKNRHGFDADLVYQFNTENDRDFEAGDVLRYDLAYQYRLWPAQYADVSASEPWSLTGLLELNGEYQWESESNGRRMSETDGHQLFLSPGLALTRKRTQYEGGLQFPIYQDVGSEAAEDDVRLVFGVTVSF